MEESVNISNACGAGRVVTNVDIAVTKQTSEYEQAQNLPKYSSQHSSELVVESVTLNGNSEIPLTPVPKSSTTNGKFGGPPKKFPLLSQNYIINEAESEQSIENI